MDKISLKQKMGLSCILFIAGFFLKELSDEQSELLKRIAWMLRYEL